jgi:hypothetical protein
MGKMESREMTLTAADIEESTATPTLPARLLKRVANYCVFVVPNVGATGISQIEHAHLTRIALASVGN